MRGGTLTSGLAPRRRAELSVVADERTPEPVVPLYPLWLRVVLWLVCGAGGWAILLGLIDIIGGAG